MEEIKLKLELHVFICTNDRSHLKPEVRADGSIIPVKPCCASHITDATVKELKLWVREQGLGSKVYVTRTGCLGYCNSEGGVMVTYPDGKFRKGFKNIDEIKEVLIPMLEKIKS